MASPSPLFDARWYAQENGLKATSSLEAARHYIGRGLEADRPPHPLFSASRYRHHVHVDRGVNPVLHYLERVRQTPQHPVSVHELFDPDFYWRTNPDVRQGGLDPLIHYLRQGWKERRNPGPYFDVTWYLGHYPDVAASGREPLTDYVMEGKSRGRRPHHLIDLDYYLALAPGLAAAGFDPLSHYIQFGDKEGRSAHPLFNAKFYKHGAQIGEMPALAHYVEFAGPDGRSPCAAFDFRYYRSHYPDTGPDPLRDYLLAPPGSRPHVHPLIDADYQRASSERAARGLDPLVDYMQYRSHLDPVTLRRGDASLPAPRPCFPVPLETSTEPRVPVASGRDDVSAQGPTTLMDVIVQGPVTSADLYNLTFALRGVGCDTASISVADWQCPPGMLPEKGNADWILFVHLARIEGHIPWILALVTHAAQRDTAFASASPAAGKSYNGWQVRESAIVDAPVALISRPGLQRLGGLEILYTGVAGAVKDAAYRAGREGLRNFEIRLPDLRVEDMDPLSRAIDEQIFRDSHSSTIEHDPHMRRLNRRANGKH